MWVWVGCHARKWVLSAGKADGRQKGQEGEEHAQEGESVVALGKMEIADGSEHGKIPNIYEGHND